MPKLGGTPVVSRRAPTGRRPGSARRDDHRSALERAVRHPMRPWPRLRRAAWRSLVAARRASRAAVAALPRRSRGAVQGPLTARQDVVETWGWASCGTDDVAAVVV